MLSLSLTYIALFLLAGLIGVGVGWTVREYLITREERMLESDLRHLRRMRPPRL